MDTSDISILVEIQKEIAGLRSLIDRLEDEKKASVLLFLVDGLERCARDADDIRTLNIHALRHGAKPSATEI